jgi:hypothetical protein
MASFSRPFSGPGFASVRPQNWTLCTPPLAGKREQPRAHDEVVPYAYLDLSNLYVGAAQVSAARLGWVASPADAAERGISDPQLRIKFGATREFLVGTSSANARCIAFGSVKDEGDTRIADSLRRNGIEPRMLRRSSSGREKGVDTGLVVTMLEDLLLGDSHGGIPDVTMVSGDRDLCEVLEPLRRRGIEVDVAAWRHTVSPELMRLARRFVPLDDHFELLTYREERT